MHFQRFRSENGAPCLPAAGRQASAQYCAYAEKITNSKSQVLNKFKIIIPKFNK